MSAASGLLLAVLGVVTLELVRRFDLRNRFEMLTGPRSVQFDPGAAIFVGAIAAVVFGLASAVWSVVG